MYTSRILAAGHYVPERIVTNAELSQLMNTTNEWIVERTGIQERRWYTPGVDTVTNMAAKASKMAMERAMQAGLVGIKIGVSGRLNGAEIARSDSFKAGNVPLQTLRADIKHAVRHSKTTYGTIGVQVWVYKGMVFKKIAHATSAALTSLPPTE